MPPAASFAAIDTRPIFDASRQPVAAPPEALSVSGSSGSLPPLTLVGIIIDRQTRLALIKLAGAPLAMSYAVGMSVSGWQIVEIEADRIVLRAGGANQEIRLTGKTQTSAPTASDNL
jgi:type II secretory pathway component PulC